MIMGKKRQFKMQWESEIMFLFSKLFHKEKKKEENDNPNVIELPCGSFTFADDDPLEIGYEAEIDWYEKTSDLYYHLEFPFVRDNKDGVYVIYDENDKATVLEDKDYYKNFLSLIYPECRGLNNIIN